jgi:hypothetical protein
MACPTNRWRWWEILLAVVLYPPGLLFTLILGSAVESAIGDSGFLLLLFWLAMPAVPLLLSCFLIACLRYRRGETPRWDERPEKPAILVTNFHRLR